MRRLSVIVLALASWVPVTASAQVAEEDEDEFYRDEGRRDGEGGGGADVGLASEVSEGPAPSRFRLSTFTYENALSARPPSSVLSSDATFYYAMSYDFRPRFYITDWLHLRGRFVLEQELANADTTTFLYEPIASDTTLEVRATDVLEPVMDWFNLGFLARLTFPTSKASLARTMVMATTGGLTLDRTFPLLAGLTLNYAFEYTRYFYQYSTATYEEPLIEPGAVARAGDADVGLYALGLGRYENGGVRNPTDLFRNTFGLDISPIENLTLSISVLWYAYLLPPVADVDATDLSSMVVCADPRACPVESGSDATDLRVSLWYIVELGYDALSWLNVAVGTSTLNPQLTPESEYRAPFFNIYTNFYFNFTINADELARFIIARAS